ncbi:GNAT family N-acetyltransferase [candidate division KSB1 bacterium]
MLIKPIDVDNDLEKVRRIAEKAFSDTSDSSLDQWLSFAEMEKTIKNKRGLCIKATSDADNIIGILYAQQENPINNEEGIEKWVIVIVAVDPEFTGKGVGSKLLSEIEKEAAERNAKKMFVYTNKNDIEVIDFYRKNGYEDAGWIKDYQYGKNNSAVFLLKYL